MSKRQWFRVTEPIPEIEAEFDDIVMANGDTLFVCRAHDAPVRDYMAQLRPAVFIPRPGPHPLEMDLEQTEEVSQ